MSNNAENTPTFDEKQLGALRSELTGAALVPGDADFERASQVWDSFSFPQRPVITILPENAGDVQAAVRFAGAHKLGVAIQGGGHGHPVPADAALFINFERMKNIEVNEKASTARFEPGVISSELVQATTAYGLAPLNGYAASVGVTGFMLGSGNGFLSRHYGASPVSIRKVELVTANGELLQVTETSNPELFWGLRGAGANFGVVTALECALYPVKEIYGGAVVFPVDNCKEILEGFLKFTETAPKELTVALRLLNFPPIPAIPEPLRGKITVFIMGCYSGDPAEGEGVLAPFRALDKPVMDTFARMPFADIARISGDPAKAPPSYFYTDTGGVTSFTPGDIETLAEIGGNVQNGLTFIEIRHLGGAMAEQPEDEMAFSYRDPEYCLYMSASVPKPEMLEKGRASIKTIMDKLKPSMPGKKLLNFIDSFGEVGPDTTKTAYLPATWQRLRLLKDNYDPDNMFRFNHNVPPTGSAVEKG